LAAAILSAQSTGEDRPRRLWDSSFINKRPPAQRPAKPSSSPNYVRVAPQDPVAAAQSSPVILGVTVWRLRPATINDDPSIILRVQEGGTGKVTDWTPERLPAQAVLRNEDRLRIAVESPTKGFLYVISREKYASGAFGKPVLIFPTLRTRGGDNSVAAGRLVEIPAQEDRPPYFTLRRGAQGYSGEVLSVLVTPQPLKDLVIGRAPLELSMAQLSEWERRWGAKAELYDLDGGAGMLWTNAEKSAAGDVTRRLTQDEPAPQTLYVVGVPPGSPLMVTVSLLLSP
jgi:hypothetical protein